MSVSDLIRELEASIARFGDLMLAVGATNGAWKAFDGLDHLTHEEMEVCSVTFKDERYDRSSVAVSELLDLLRSYRAEIGNMQVVVVADNVMHSRLDLNVDQDVGPDGEEINVAIIQAYVVKPAFNR